jgi:hypothetical protein
MLVERLSDLADGDLVMAPDLLHHLFLELVELRGDVSLSAHPYYAT